jgi:hypothetical protein
MPLAKKTATTLARLVRAAADRVTLARDRLAPEHVIAPGLPEGASGGKPTSAFAQRALS